MKISDEQLQAWIELLETAEPKSDAAMQNIIPLAVARELQQLREALTWKPASAGINPECDVFEVKLGGEICDVYTALIVGEYYQIGGVHNSREGFYFGQWDLESLLEDYPNFLWREIVEVPMDLPEVE